MYRAFAIALCGLTLICSSCGHHGRRSVTTCFYHWKTKINLTPEDQSMLDSTGCKKLYVNFFDVVPNNDTASYNYPAIPGAKTTGLHKLPKGMEIVPVVYITNTAIKKMDSANIPLIAEKLCSKVARLAQMNHTGPIKELQIDCDWSRSTRDKYFYLLSEIKKQMKIPTISATIRLYQYKYFDKTGVPPADRGLLMFYNMNAIQDVCSKDLILDVEEGKKYMNGKRYPLKLDYALPLFSEMVTNSHRYENVTGFYAPFIFYQLEKNNFLTRVDSGSNRYILKRVSDDLGFYLPKGDTIKLETTDKEKLKQAADLLSARANSDTFNIIFFHLDKDANSPFTAHEVKDIVHRFY